MNAQPKIWTAPGTIGAGPGSAVAFVGSLFAVLTITVAFEIATMYAAARLNFDPALGRPWAERPHIGAFVLVREVYQPFAIVGWLYAFANPFGGMQSAAVTSALEAATWVLCTGVVAAIVTTVVLVAALDRWRPRGSELHDSGHWSTIEELREDGILDAKAGPIVGGYEIRPGRVIPLRYNGENGMEYVAAPGDGKSSLLKTNFLIPLQDEEAHTWSARRRRAEPWGEEPSIIALDLKGELLKSTSGYQKRKLGKDVLVFAPYGIRGWRDQDLSQYNTFSTIRLGTPDTFDDCYAKGIDIADAEGKGLPTHWDKTCCAWYAGVIEKLAWLAHNTGNLDYFSLPGLYDFLASFQSINDCIRFMLEVEDDPEGVYAWKDVQNGVLVDTKVSPTVAAAAREMAMKEGPEVTSVHSTALSFLTYLRSRRIRNFVQRSTWDMRSLANDPKRARIVYVVIPPGKLKAIRPLLRMMVNDLIRTNMEGVDVVDGRSVRSNARSLIFVGDEIAALKNLDELETSSGYARGFGIMFWLFWQSVAQKYKHYTENESITETLDVSVFGRPKTTKAARHIVDLLGKIDVAVRKRSTSGKRNTIAAGRDQESESSDEVSRDLLTTTEVRRIEKTHVLGFWNGRSIYLTKFDFWRNPILSKRSRIAPVTRSDRTRDPSAPIVVPSRAVHVATGIVASAAAAPATMKPAGQSENGDPAAPSTAEPPAPAKDQVGANVPTPPSPGEAVAAESAAAFATLAARLSQQIATSTPATGGSAVHAALLDLGRRGTPSLAELLGDAQLEEPRGEDPADDERSPDDAPVDRDDDPHAVLRAEMLRLSLSTELAATEDVDDDGYENDDERA